MDRWVIARTGFGVDEQAAAADAGSEFGDSEDDVCEQRGAEASAIVGEVDAETRKEGDRLEALAGAFAEPLGCVIDGDAGHGPGVVALRVGTGSRRTPNDP